jgi:hypothetical protein
VNVTGVDLRGRPPATVIACGHDILRTDGVRPIGALSRGAESLHPHHGDMPLGFPDVLPAYDESMDEMAREVTRRLGAPDAVSASATNSREQKPQPSVSHA